MKITRKFILAGIIAIILPTYTSTAASANNEGYWVDSSGTIGRDSSGECWHTGFWTPAMAVEGCDPVTEQKVIPPIVEKPMPTPMPVPMKAPAQVQAKMPPQKITLSEEDLFNFNGSELRPKGKAKLDDFVHDLEGTKYGLIHVTGYTDRIGSAEYNQRLSLRRANDVKDYLASKGIPADRIKAEGKGEMQPITKPTECRGMTSAQEIACLQPDRRVEVMVEETK